MPMQWMRMIHVSFHIGRKMRGRCDRLKMHYLQSKKWQFKPTDEDHETVFPENQTPHEQFTQSLPYQDSSTMKHIFLQVKNLHTLTIQTFPKKMTSKF